MDDIILTVSRRLRLSNTTVTEDKDMLRELGISGGTLIMGLVIGYFVIKWAVREAIIEAHYSITGEKSKEEKMIEEALENDREVRRATRAAKEAD